MVTRSSGVEKGGYGHAILWGREGGAMVTRSSGVEKGGYSHAIL